MVNNSRISHREDNNFDTEPKSRTEYCDYFLQILHNYSKNPSLSCSPHRRGRQRQKNNSFQQFHRQTFLFQLPVLNFFSNQYWLWSSCLLVFMGMSWNPPKTNTKCSHTLIPLFTEKGRISNDSENHIIISLSSFYNNNIQPPALPLCV